ncbi:hypothetical protein D026_1618 [Vibrio parahaemolyticus 605]|nr:conserved hypothetical protein [Vibrio parahaemolyticus AN-5034]EQL95492.1 hypothetical protein D035_1889 [Vibrio parahaemolyticus VP250]EQM01344.1 hypothetical protein D040_3607 [Vibrio parahaemolyticus NIHCB0603]EQM05496.1 hypothetical protein D045_4977 [Vibrio parahaemolyticus VP-NY4]ETS23432.1 hypothetical protein D033_0879 [Vibrio parahaemolyticus B-265]ETT11427.1 hypothetical protein D026_1618 [Vibrio parahaemolyticus 605]ETX23739.1 hypothetical protein D037_2528 [Vibrio parahaemolyt
MLLSTIPYVVPSPFKKMKSYWHFIKYLFRNVRKSFEVEVE